MSQRTFGALLSNCCVYMIGGLLSGGGMAAMAQTTSGLEEIIVTAQKREQSAQDVGIAITAFSANDLETFGFVNGTDIAAFTPGVHLSGANAGNSTQFTIRGAVQNDFGDIPEAPNAVYVDEAYMLAPQAQMFANFDMERVEILKGPQGTLFGRNATGGLVNFATKKPTREFEAYADTEYGRFDSLRIEGAVNAPLTDSLSARLSGFRNRHDPIYNNTFTEADLPATPAFLAAQGRGPLTSDPENNDDLWVDDQWAVRAQLLFEPNDDITFHFKGDYARTQPGSGAYQQVSTVAFVDDTDGNGIEDNVIDTRFARDVLSDGFLCEQISARTGQCVDSVLDLDFDGVRPNASGDFFGHFEPDGKGPDIQTDHATQDQDVTEIWGFTGKLTWDLGFATLTSVTARYFQEKRQSLDVDSGPAPQFIILKDGENKWFTQELRLEGETERTRWTTGVYLLTANVKFAQGLADTIGGINVFGGLFFNGFLSDAGDFLEETGNAELDTDSYSVFGQIEYDLTDKLTFTGGFRAIVEEKDYTFISRIFDSPRDSRLDSTLFAGGAPLTIPGTDVPFEFLIDPFFQQSTSDFLYSGKAQFDYAYSDDLLFYAGFNRGIKAGSFNSPLLTFLSRDKIQYDEEILKSYEAGFKSTFLENRVRFNLSAYYYDYEDYQAFQFIGTSGAIINANAKYKGGEAELALVPIDNLNFNFGVAYIDPEVKNVEVAANVKRDVEPAFTPEVQFNGLARYTWQSVNMLFGGSVSLQLDGNYASSTFQNINNFGTHKQPGYWVGNARVNWISQDGSLEIGGHVNNFTDTLYQTIGFELTTICGCDEASFGKPRWWGINVRYNYN